MDYLRNKNILLSILAGTLIIAGSFWNVYETEIAAMFSNSKNVNDEGLSIVKTAMSTSTAALAISPGNTLEPINPYKEPYKYQVSDIKTGGESNLSSLKLYGVNLASALKPISGKTKSPVDLISDTYVNEKYADLAILTDMRVANEAAEKSVLAMDVPKELRDVHTDLANHLHRTAELLVSMSELQTEPVLALTSARQYADEMNVRVMISNYINKFFADKNIAFSKTEIAQINVPITQ